MQLQSEGKFHPSLISETIKNSAIKVKVTYSFSFLNSPVILRIAGAMYVRWGLWEGVL
jgi:hypothetical protein